MFFQRIESEGLSHYSYIFGDDTDAIVIDPRVDSHIYAYLAHSKGLRIRYILETHRNEDIVVGSRVLSSSTNAAIWHADSQLDYEYGNPVSEGQEWKIGNYTIKAVATPGHTEGSISYILYDKSGSPWMVFTGDLLFAGEVGRCDLLGEKKLKEMAGKMYDSIFKKILPLGDGVVICPAHGAGSACGSKIIDRKPTTIGMEKRLNEYLKAENRKQFIDLASRMIPRPPYFRLMEKYNLSGVLYCNSRLDIMPLDANDFADACKECTILDIREETAFAAAHIPGSLSINSSLVARYAGWFIDYNKKLILVAEPDDAVYITRTLARIGFFEMGGFLSGGILSWHTSGKATESIGTINVKDFCELLDGEQLLHILDVRSDGELENDGKIPNSQHIPLHEIPQRIDQIPRQLMVYIFCGSGVRSMVAASFLKQNRLKNLTVVLGGFAGWKSKTCSIDKGE